MSGCADVCIDVDYDYDAPSLFTHKEVTARKPHRCCECREPITQGTRYERVAGKWDGTFQTFHTCALCLEIRTAFFCGGYEFEAMWTWIEEQLFPLWKKSGPWDCLAKLTTDEARTKMNTRFKAWISEDEEL